jgi:predicted nucleic acid-binding protein
VKYLLDTNIISEIRKGSDCDPQVAVWYDSIDEESIYVSVLVLGEIRKGIERARPPILPKPAPLRSGFPL